jgi:hypothetical protein
LCSEQQHVTVAEIEEAKASCSEAQHQRCNARIYNCCTASIILSCRARAALTNDDKVHVLGEQLAPLHASEGNVAVVLLAWRLVEELVEKDKGKDVGIVEEVIRCAGQALNDKVRKIRI